MSCRHLPFAVLHHTPGGADDRYQAQGAASHDAGRASPGEAHVVASSTTLVSTGAVTAAVKTVVAGPVGRLQVAASGTTKGFHAAARGTRPVATLTHTLSSDASARAQLAKLKATEPPRGGTRSLPEDLIDAESRRRWRRAEWLPQQPLPGNADSDPWEFFLGRFAQGSETATQTSADHPVVPRGPRIPGDGSTGAVENPAVLLFAFNRPRYLAETLRSLSAQEQLPKFTVYVSQDGTD